MTASFRFHWHEWPATNVITATKEFESFPFRRLAVHPGRVMEADLLTVGYSTDPKRCDCSPPVRRRDRSPTRRGGRRRNAPSTGRGNEVCFPAVLPRRRRARPTSRRRSANERWRPSCSAVDDSFLDGTTAGRFYGLRGMPPAPVELVTIRRRRGSLPGLAAAVDSAPGSTERCRRAMTACASPRRADAPRPLRGSTTPVRARRRGCLAPPAGHAGAGRRVLASDRRPGGAGSPGCAAGSAA